PYNETTGTDDFNDGLANARPPGVPRNSLQKTGSANLDVRWSKEFRLRGREQPRLVVGLDALNALNRVSYTNFSGDLSSPLFRQPITAGQARHLQASLTVKF